MACSCSDPVPIPPPRSVQPIYPYEVSPTPFGPGCQFRVPHQQALVFPFMLCPGKAVEVVVTHTGRVQDRSLRVWVANEPIGTHVIYNPYYLSFWHPNRVSPAVITVYDKDMQPPEGRPAAIPVEPGPIFINVLNMINSFNEFGLRLTQLGVQPTP